MGIGILSAGIILAIMIIPFIASVMRDVFEVTPPMLKESAYGLGATTWEVVYKVVLPFTKTGVVGGIMLGLGRALGETMAVTFVIGNQNQLISCRCSRRPTASPRCWPTNLPRRRRPAPFRADVPRAGSVRHHLHRAVVRQGAAGAPEARRGSPAITAISAVSGPRLAMHLRRKRVNAVALTLAFAAMVFGVFWLVWILFETIVLGAGGMFVGVAQRSRRPGPNSEGGGLSNAIFGSLVMVTFATVIGTPIGIFSGIYLAEYGQKGRLARDHALHQRRPAVGAVAS